MSAPGRHRATSRSGHSGRTGLATTVTSATTAAQRRRWRTGILSLGAVTALGVGVSVGPSASAASSYNGDFSMGQLDDLLNNDMILDYLEICRTAAGATPVPGAGSEGTEGTEDSGDAASTRPVAVADCSQATGDGLAIVLPDRIELGNAAENTTIDLGKDIKVLGYTYRLGERNLFEILSAAALGSDTIKNIVGGLGLPKIDPTKLGEYSSYEQVQADAALPVNMKTERYCSGGIEVGGTCLWPGKWKEKTYDANAEKRAEALKIAEYLTGHTYDASQPVELPDLASSGPRGTATIAGDGISVAAAMRDGNALAEARKLFGLPSAALAGADQGRSTIAHSTLGISTALNMDTDDISLTWFGQALNLDRLRELGVEKYAGDDVMDLLDTAENLDIPALKEVSCFGISATATAEGLGSCTNILGTLDRYEDLRAPVAGESRQTQWGLTDLSSLVLGNDALVKQLTGAQESTPFLDDLMTNITGEEGRLKFAKDFVRFTKNVTTDGIEVPVLDDEGIPVLDDEGHPVVEKTTHQTTAAWLTSDYGLREPVTVEWSGHRVIFFPGVDVNGSTRPNILSLPQIEKITDDADSGILPKISLVTWDNAFGLGTVTLDDLTRPDRIFTNWVTSVTLPDDLKWLGNLVNPGADEELTEDPADTEETAASTDTSEPAEPEAVTATSASTSASTSVEPVTTDTDTTDTGTTDTDENDRVSVSTPEPTAEPAEPAESEPAEPAASAEPAESGPTEPAEPAEPADETNEATVG
ncbi:hypothetical protein [uncultured Corynebacterium sp.]|uniref:hypothetical protein n=1 Tax=uncultured Corynebacterium sp. TaxID=159447 RepID=UPI0025E27DBC|nr:hypothetical protein [uncultured Corynebacterium sp.]